MVSLTTGELGEHTTLAVMVALVFVYVVNVHKEQREYEKRIDELEKINRRTEDNHQESDGDT